MGQKSDDDILASLAEHKAERATDDTPDEISGVGEVLPDEESKDDSKDEDTEDTDGTEEEAEESGQEAEESDGGESEIEDDEVTGDADEADKEIARVHEATKEGRLRLDEKIEELAAKEQEGVERLAKAEALEAKHVKLSKRWRQAPIALAKSQGIETAQDFLDLGQKYYRYGKSMAPDAKPELKSWANGVERDGEQESSVSELRAEVKALTEVGEARIKEAAKEAEDAKQLAETTAEFNTFADSVVKECSGEYPMAAKVIGGMTDDEARTSIIELTENMFKENKKAPTKKQILEAVEKYERKKLKSLGLDPDELFPRTNSKDKSGTASKEKKAPMKNKSKKKPQVKSDEEILALLKQRREELQNA